jgi:hypothetical protein
MMVQRIPNSGLDNPILEQIEEDMDVYDRSGDKIGEVEDIYLGSVGEDAVSESRGPATADDPDQPGRPSFIQELAEVFTGEDELPEVVRNRLLRQGFIRVDGSGLFGSDYYVMPEQIASVSQDRVQLKVSRDELIKP